MRINNLFESNLVELLALKGALPPLQKFHRNASIEKLNL